MKGSPMLYDVGVIHIMMNHLIYFHGIFANWP
jgi:hypothetical protein